MKNKQIRRQFPINIRWIQIVLHSIFTKVGIWESSSHYLIVNHGTHGIHRKIPCIPWVPWFKTVAPVKRMYQTFWVAGVKPALDFFAGCQARSAYICRV